MDNKEYYKKTFDEQLNKCLLNKKISFEDVERKKDILCSSAVAFAEQECAKIMYSTFIGFAAIGIAAVSIAVSILNSIDKTQDPYKLGIMICVLGFVGIVITIVYFYRVQPNKKVINSILKSRAIDDAIKYAEKFNDNIEGNFKEYLVVQILPKRWICGRLYSIHKRFR